MKVYSSTIDTQPFYETKGKTHFARIIDWFELNDYNITNNSVKNIYKCMDFKKSMAEQIKFLNEINLINKNK